MWLSDHSLEYVTMPCNYICFVAEIWSEFMFRVGTVMHNDVKFVKEDFLHARDRCRYQYGLSNYKPLFGLSNYIDLKDVYGSRPNHWLGNVRGEDTSLYKKGTFTM